MTGHGETLLPRRYAVVDVETSGLTPGRHHLLQVGVVVVDAQGTVLERWSSLVHPTPRWWFRVGPTRLHGIRWRDAVRAPDAATVLADLARLLDGTVFVAHNADFDLAFLRAAADEHGVTLPIDEVLCTLRLSRRLDPKRLQSHRLGDLCERLGVELIRPHDALADADATAAVLPHLLRAHGLIDGAATDGPPADTAGAAGRVAPTDGAVDQPIDRPGAQPAA